MSDIAIKVDHVTKRFRLYDNDVTGPIRDALTFWRKPVPGTYFDEFTAVDDVSLEVHRGEVVGIIGPNGAGKTTLLKTIAGLLPVNEGTIEVNGRLTSLFAHGVVVHPEFSGRENIFHNGIMVGLTPEEISEKTPWIIEFANLGDFIDRPVRTYSSGMRARLLFSISMSVNPDILVIDEGLATGDAQFIKKCQTRIRDICNHGATVLMVTHDMTTMRIFCNRAILLIEGKIHYQGDQQDVAQTYTDYVFDRTKPDHEIDDPTEMRFVDGTGAVRIENARLLDRDGKETRGFHSGDCLILELDYVSDLPEDAEAHFFLGILRQPDGEWVGEISTVYQIEDMTSGTRKNHLRLQRRGKIIVRMEPLLLLNNHYEIWLKMFSEAVCVYDYRGVTPFFVSKSDYVFERGPLYWQPCRIEC